jgi:hypothetical protein
MNCPESLDLLQRRLDGEIIADLAELEQHLVGCAECRAKHAAAARLLEGLKALSPALPSRELDERITTMRRLVPPSGLAERITARVLADRVDRQRRLRFRWWATVGLAACILIMASAAYFGLPFPRENPPSNGPGPVVKDKPLPEVVANGPSLQQSVAEARRAVASLTDRLTAETKEKARRLLAAAPPMGLTEVVALPSVRELDGPLDPAADALMHTGQGISDGLEPVARSARQAVGYFSRQFAFTNAEGEEN